MVCGEHLPATFRGLWRVCEPGLERTCRSRSLFGKYFKRFGQTMYWGALSANRGNRGLVGVAPPTGVAAGVHDSLNPGLLGRLWLPSVAQSARSLVGDGEGCDRADCAPAACFVAGKDDFEALSVGARSAFVSSALQCREVDGTQMRTRHPAARPLPVEARY